jgi:hypothetical protein
MITRVAIALVTILLLPLLAIALPVLFVMAWTEEASRERALRMGIHKPVTEGAFKG